eukprot:492170-Pleurochrysis_carterae.AAC.2
MLTLEIGCTSTCNGGSRWFPSVSWARRSSELFAAPQPLDNHAPIGALGPGPNLAELGRAEVRSRRSARSPLVAS